MEANSIVAGGCCQPGGIGLDLIDIILNRRREPERERQSDRDNERQRDRDNERERAQDKKREREAKTLKRELAKYRQQHEELLSRFDDLVKQLQKKKIETFEQLAEQDREARRSLIRLAKETKSMRMQGRNIGLFGLTSTGKSTTLNSLLGEIKAATGYGETTLQITPYKGNGYTLWDFPGRNDQISYLSMEYISFFKGLSNILILILSTLKENSSLMKLLEEIGLSYDLVFNKFDLVPEEEQDSLKQQIQSEVQTIGLTRVNNIYFISARNPAMFPDWRRMVQNFTA